MLAISGFSPSCLTRSKSCLFPSCPQGYDPSTDSANLCLLLLEFNAVWPNNQCCLPENVPLPSETFSQALTFSCSAVRNLSPLPAHTALTAGLCLVTWTSTVIRFVLICFPLPCAKGFWGLLSLIFRWKKAPNSLMQVPPFCILLIN